MYVMADYADPYRSLWLYRYPIKNQKSKGEELFKRFMANMKNNACLCVAVCHGEIFRSSPSGTLQHDVKLG
jgi:lipoprotein NlpI